MKSGGAASRPGAGRWAVVLLAAAALSWVALATTPAAALEGSTAASIRSAVPLPVRNLTPVTLLYGLPRSLGALAMPGETELSLRLEHANNFTAGGTAESGTAVFDGTTTVTGVIVRRSLGSRLEWGLELPYVHHGGGFTDGFIDGFHDLFGLPDGGRDAVPRDRLDYRLVNGGETRVQLDDATGDVGDVRGWLGYRLHAGEGRQAVLRGMVKAPTGRVPELSGSEGTDLALTLELVDGRLLEAAGVTLTLMGGVSVLGKDELPGTPHEDLVWSGHLGLHYPLTGNLVLRAQLDGHSDVIDVGTRQFGGATLQGTLGGTLALATGQWLDIGVVEDLSGASAPDVVFLLTLGVRL